MLTLNVPEGGPTSVYAANGQEFRSRMVDGRLVIDLPPETFRSLLSDRRNGLLWYNANPEALLAISNPRR